MDYLTAVRDRARDFSQQLFGENASGSTLPDVSFASTAQLRLERPVSFNNFLSRIKSSASELLDQINSDGQKKIDDARAFLFSKNYTQVQSSENIHLRYPSCVKDNIENFTAGKTKRSKSLNASERREMFSKFHEGVLNDQNEESLNSQCHFVKDTSKDAFNISPANITQINICKPDAVEYTRENSSQNHAHSDFLPFFKEFDGLDKVKTTESSESMQAFLRKGNNVSSLAFQKDPSLKRRGKAKEEKNRNVIDCAFNSDREVNILKDEKCSTETVISHVTTVPVNSSNEELPEQDILVSTQGNYPTIHATVQFLIMSKKLKVTIKGLENMPYKNDILKNTFVEVSLELEKRHITKRANRTGNKDGFSYSKAIYFSNIDLKGAHMSCLRFRLSKKLAIFKLKSCICLGESLVHLNNLDIVGSVSVSAKLEEKSKRCDAKKSMFQRLRDIKRDVY